MSRTTTKLRKQQPVFQNKIQKNRTNSNVRKNNILNHRSDQGEFLHRLLYRLPPSLAGIALPISRKGIFQYWAWVILRLLPTDSIRHFLAFSVRCIPSFLCFADPIAFSCLKESAVPFSQNRTLLFVTKISICFILAF